MRTHAGWLAVLPWVTAYAVCMAFLESAVVIYLRQLYYPTEFAFPVAPIDPHIAVTELLRELATMVMLLAPGALLTTKRLERFAWFCFCFGIWDIFYYVFLKAILDWPSSVLDWDILFLVPVVWVGPVLAPCLVSVGLIALGCIILQRRRSDSAFTLARGHWVLLIIAGALVLFTFVEEPCRHILSAANSGQLSSLPTAGHMALDSLRDYLPEHYSWGVFAVACGLAIGALLDLGLRKGKARVA
jgi:hypothetical protein